MRRASSLSIWSLVAWRIESSLDPLGTDDLVTHRLPLEEAPHGYEIFQQKADGAIKVVLEP